MHNAAGMACVSIVAMSAARGLRATAVVISVGQAGCYTTEHPTARQAESGAGYYRAQQQCMPRTWGKRECVFACMPSSEIMLRMW
jgi:hypothetical protein